MVMILNAFKQIGRYTDLMGRTFTRPDNWRLFFKQLPKELVKLGINSIGIVVIISIFTGVIMRSEERRVGKEC